MGDRGKALAGRRGAFWLVGAILLLACLELVCFVGLRFIDDRLDLRPLRDREVRGWVRWSSERPRVKPGEDSSLPVFDRDLGWDHDPPVRGGAPPTAAGRRSYASSYGDSFTWCFDVKADETWQHHFTRRTGNRILNLGIGGAGSDQALLKLRKYWPSHPTEVVIFGLFPNDISRNVGMVGSFYLVPRYFNIKPRFVIGRQGAIELYNPLPEILASEARGDRSWLPALARRDFWYNQVLDRYGYDLLRGRSFPHLLQAGRLVAGILGHGLELPGDDNFAADPSSEAMRLTMHTLGRFVAMAREERFTPVVLIHGTPEEMEEGLVGHLVTLLRRELGVQVEDAIALMGYAPGKAGAAELFSPGRHYSSRGNEALARGLARVLPPPRAGPSSPPTPAIPARGQR